MSKRKRKQDQDIFAQPGQDENITSAMDDIFGERRPAVRNRLKVRDDGIMEYAGFQLSRVGIQKFGENFEQFADFLRQLETGVQWWVGDLLMYAEREYGTTYEQVAEQYGFEVKTCYQYKWVAQNVELSVRTENLSFTHHQLVAKLPTDEQRRWLEQAEANGWSVAQLRAEMKSGADVVVTPPEVDTDNVRKAVGRVERVMLKRSKGEEIPKKKVEQTVKDLGDIISWAEGLRDDLRS